MLRVYRKTPPLEKKPPWFYTTVDIYCLFNLN